MKIFLQNMTASFQSQSFQESREFKIHARYRMLLCHGDVVTHFKHIGGICFVALWTTSLPLLYFLEHKLYL